MEALSQKTEKRTTIIPRRMNTLVVIVLVVSSLLVAEAAWNCSSGYTVVGTVYYDASSGTYSYKPDIWDTEGAAYGQYVDCIYETGWGELSIATNEQFDDAVQSYAAGYLEGALTAKRISEFWYDSISNMIVLNEQLNSDNYSTSDNNHMIRSRRSLRKFPASSSDKLKAWFEEHISWLTSQIFANNASSPYWYMAGLIWQQFQGLLAGHNSQVGFEFGMSEMEFYMLVSEADMETVWQAIGGPSSTFAEPNVANLHCSALIKPIFPNSAQNSSELFVGHSTWTAFGVMLRVFKNFRFAFHNAIFQKFSGVPGNQVSFSSYPGYLSSVDDFYVLSSGLVVTETTLNVFNETLLSLITPQSVLSWMRAVTANRLAASGPQWVWLFSEYNSGTYSNEWIVVDYNLFDVATVKSLADIPDNTVWIAEQMPGSVSVVDVTPVVRENGYWASYNVPYIPYVYNISGYAQMAKEQGSVWTWHGAPRAQIFQRNQSDVSSLESMEQLMRYNNFEHDPMSQGDPVHAICSRFDLLNDKPIAMGCVDSKIASVESVANIGCIAQSGPTHDQQPAFRWDEHGPIWEQTYPHIGQPTVFNFGWESQCFNCSLAV